MMRVPEIPAGTRIHRRGEHEAGGIAEAHRRTRDRDHPVFHRLAQHLEHVLTELGELVQEQHAAVRQAHLDRKSTRLNSSHGYISYAVFCLKKKTECWTGDARERRI